MAPAGGVRLPRLCGGARADVANASANAGRAQGQRLLHPLGSAGEGEAEPRSPARLAHCDGRHERPGVHLGRPAGPRHPSPHARPEKRSVTDGVGGRRPAAAGGVRQLRCGPLGRGDGPSALEQGHERRAARAPRPRPLRPQPYCLGLLLWMGLLRRSRGAGGAVRGGDKVQDVERGGGDGQQGQAESGQEERPEAAPLLAKQKTRSVPGPPPRGGHLRPHSPPGSGLSGAGQGPRAVHAVGATEREPRAGVLPARERQHQRVGSR
mmetsp:Transcript_8044/g.33844  ORF Transcript_8044/g.33844 Transcript_8044/m.33844 type:complete len:266 (-) Transcript_8044:813-1610(-)